MRWLYRVPDDVYRAEMQSADLLVLPLKYSTAVNTVLEALACGVPVVTTLGGISDYLDESCSVQTPPGAAEAMARKILELLDEPDVLQSMRSLARKQAEKFAWPRIAAQLRGLFSTLF
ncbi:MAG: glycosyltransferase [Candidatus Methanomethylicaceae archaeon]